MFSPFRPRVFIVVRGTRPLLVGSYPFTVRRRVVVVVVVIAARRLFVGRPPSFRLTAARRRGRRPCGRGSAHDRDATDRGTATTVAGRRVRRRHGVPLLGPDGHLKTLLDLQTGAPDGGTLHTERRLQRQRQR